jgi:hypothetical protein
MATRKFDAFKKSSAPAPSTKPAPVSAAELRLVCPPELVTRNRTPGVALQARAWQWALGHRAPDGSLPSGAAISAAYGRQARWGRLVKKAGRAGAFGSPGGPRNRRTHGDPGEVAAAGSDRG